MGAEGAEHRRTTGVRWGREGEESENESAGGEVWCRLDERLREEGGGGG